MIHNPEAFHTGQEKVTGIDVAYLVCDGERIKNKAGAVKADVAVDLFDCPGQFYPHLVSGNAQMGPVPTVVEVIQHSVDHRQTIAAHKFLSTAGECGFTTSGIWMDFNGIQVSTTGKGPVSNLHKALGKGNCGDRCTFLEGIPANLLQTLRKHRVFQQRTVSKGGRTDCFQGFREMNNPQIGALLKGRLVNDFGALRDDDLLYHSVFFAELGANFYGTCR